MAATDRQGAEGAMSPWTMMALPRSPWRSVLDNVMLRLEIRKTPKPRASRWS